MLTQQDAALANDNGQEQCTGGFATLRGLGKRSQEGDDLIPGNRLQQSGCSSQTLQTSAQGGEEGANQNDPLIWPGNIGHHQLATNRLTESGIVG